MPISTAIPQNFNSMYTTGTITTLLSAISESLVLCLNCLELLLVPVTDELSEASSDDTKLDISLCTCCAHTHTHIMTIVKNWSYTIGALAIYKDSLSRFFLSVYFDTWWK